MIGRLKSIFPKRGSALIAALVAVSLSCGWVHAIMHEGITLALEAAFPYVKDGFKIREDNWSGETKSEKPLLVKHQLFRGNEYWFWAATSFPDSKVTVGIFDDSGNSVGLESFSKDGKAGVRVLPKKTGSYFIRVYAASDKHPKLDWGLVYGYR